MGSIGVWGRAGALTAVVAAALAVATGATAAHVAPVLVVGNPPCTGQLKLEPVASGTYAASFGSEAGSIRVTVRQTASGQVFDFATDRASHLVTVALVKGGSTANRYDYGAGVASDTDLHAPLNPANGSWYGLSHLCFGTALAPPPSVDVCPNISGDQATIPPGMIKDANGNCVTPPTDVCPNIPGDQATIPPGMVKDANGNCVTPPPPLTDVCPNIDGVQTTIPPGMVKDANGNCVTPPPPTDVCPNVDGVQATVPPGMIKDASGNCVTPAGPPPPLIDLAVTKVDTPDPISVGRELSYSIVVANRGPVRATGVTMTDVLPGGLRIVSTRASQGSCSATGARITCRLGALAAGASATVSLRARPSAPGLLLNVARVHGNEPDPRPENNSSSVTTRVVAPFQPPAAVCDSLTVGRRTIVVGARTTLRVVVKARGRGLGGVRVRVRGAGIDVSARTNRAGVALVSVRARRAGIVSIGVTGQGCSRRIGAIDGGQPDLTG